MNRRKLVRDKIPEIIRASGREPKVRIASIDEFDYLLREKLVEESQELLESGSTDEIADICEVLEALFNHRGVTRDEISKIAETKRSQHGAFLKRYVLDSE